jgi:hypothetical protein
MQNKLKMKIVKVTYTTKLDFAETNQKNINQVMADLKAVHDDGVFYHVCLSQDNKTFIHTAFFKSDEGEKVLLELSSFKHFQEQLKSSVPEVPPKQELLTLVGSSKNIFNS